MKNFIITESEKNEILAKHNLAKMILEAKMETVSDLEKEIERLQKKIEEIKKKSKKTETNEDSFDSLVDSDVDYEEERDSLQQS
jgi:tRNA(Phe) wybutosine-synthesizing methylase Tyw3